MHVFDRRFVPRVFLSKSVGNFGVSTLLFIKSGFGDFPAIWIHYTSPLSFKREDKPDPVTDRLRWQP